MRIIVADKSLVALQPRHIRAIPCMHVRMMGWEGGGTTELERICLPLLLPFRSPASLLQQLLRRPSACCLTEVAGRGGATGCTKSASSESRTPP